MIFFFINYVYNKVIENPKNKIVEIFVDIKGLKNIFVKIY
jgi:hypothetical protein